MPGRVVGAAQRRCRRPFRSSTDTVAESSSRRRGRACRRRSGPPLTTSRHRAAVSTARRCGREGRRRRARAGSPSRWPPFATTRSGLPSPLRSAIATETGTCPLTKSTWGEGAVAVVEQHRHCAGGQFATRGRACRRRSGRRPRPTGRARARRRSRPCGRKLPSPAVEKQHRWCAAVRSRPRGRACRRRSGRRSRPRWKRASGAVVAPGGKVPSPGLRSTVTAPRAALETARARHRRARSGLPSPFRSPIATDAGSRPVG